MIKTRQREAFLLETEMQTFLIRTVWGKNRFFVIGTLAWLYGFVIPQIRGGDRGFSGRRLTAILAPVIARSVVT